MFERYGLSEKENDNAAIERALESHKEKEGWEAKLNSKNDKIRSRAKEEKQRWTEDRDILLDKQSRENYLKEYYDAVREIVEYINDNQEEESSFEGIAAIQGISEDTAKSIYEKHKNLDIKEDVDLNEVQELAFKINKVQNAYNALVGKCDTSVKDKFLENNVNINSLFEALSVTACGSAREIEENSYKVSKLAYDLYNKQLFSSEIKNGFMDIFDAKSTKEDSVVSFIENENIDKHFSVNNWVLLRYIRTTCTLMKKSGTVSEQKITNLALGDRFDFAQAMKQVFGVSIDVSRSNEDSSSESYSQLPIEVSQGEIELKRGQFDRAKALFAQASSKDPYCWQAYWGLFKASVQAKTDNEVYFPGFIEQLRQSEVTGSGPDYIEYYKSAKFNAVAQHVKDINFTEIEIEYKRADQANAEVRELVEHIKSKYESADVNVITSEKGKVVCQKIIEKKDELLKWKNIDAKGNLWNIAIMFAGICIVNLGLMFTQIDFFANSTIGGILCLISMFGPAAVVIWMFSDSIFGIASGVVLGVISYFAITLIERLCSESFSYRIVYVAIFLLVGALIMLFAYKKIAKYRAAGKQSEKILAEMYALKDELIDEFLKEVDMLFLHPAIKKYRVPFPRDVKISFNKYTPYLD